MNSGGLKISISSWMYNLSIYFESFLNLAQVSCSVSVLLQRGKYYRLARIMVHLDVLGELLILVVLTIVRVFLQMYMGCLEKKCVLMIED